jgi:hypothetical protein
MVVLPKAPGSIFCVVFTIDMTYFYSLVSPLLYIVDVGIAIEIGTEQAGAVIGVAFVDIGTVLTVV